MLEKHQTRVAALIKTKGEVRAWGTYAHTLQKTHAQTQINVGWGASSRHTGISSSGAATRLRGLGVRHTGDRQPVKYGSWQHTHKHTQNAIVDPGRFYVECRSLLITGRLRSRWVRVLSGVTSSHPGHSQKSVPSYSTPPDARRVTAAAFPLHRCQVRII